MFADFVLKPHCVRVVLADYTVTAAEIGTVGKRMGHNKPVKGIPFVQVKYLVLHQHILW